MTVDLRRRTLLRIVTILVTSCAILACQPPPEDDSRRLAADKVSTAELNRINTLLASSRPVTRIDIDSLNRLREQYPNLPAVRQLLQGALIKRGDWSAAEEIISATAEDKRTNPERITLAKIYIKQGKFAPASSLLKSMAPTPSENVEVKALLGQSQFYNGELDAAAASIESVQADLATQKRGDDLATLGTIYFRRGDRDKALEVLQKAVEVSPNSLIGHSTLSRVYAAAGDNDKAELYRARLQAINDKIAADEKKKTYLVPLFYALEDAYEAKDYDRVIALVKQIQPEADSGTMATLYQYLAAAYRAQGKETEAQNALAEAAKLK